MLNFYELFFLILIVFSSQALSSMEIKNKDGGGYVYTKWEIKKTKGSYGGDDIVWGNNLQCRNLRDYMNAYAKISEKKNDLLINACPQAILNSTEFEKPAWVALDANSHKNLIALLLRYQKLGSHRFYEYDKLETSLTAGDLSEANFFIGDGGKIFSWNGYLSQVVNLLIDGKAVSVQNPKLSVVQLVWPIKKNKQNKNYNRKKCDVPENTGIIFLVDDALSKPLIVNDGAFDNSYMLMKSGVPVFIQVYFDEVDINSPLAGWECVLVNINK